MTATTTRDLLDAWERLRHAVPENTAAHVNADYLALARQAITLGHPTLACEILAAAPTTSPSPQARWLTALAHAKTGALREAAAGLAPLLRELPEGPLAVECLALAGRIAKDRCTRLPPGAARDLATGEAISHYLHAWDLGADPFPGVNAATLLFAAGQHDAGRALARKVMAVVTQAPMEPHWRQATLGELSLLLGEDAQAAEHYAAAAREAGTRVGDVASMRRQLRLIAAARDVPAQVEAALRLPAVVVFTGHMIDAPGVASERFPAHLEAAVAHAIAQRLDAMNAGFGYCSAACGGDLLFIEAMLARGAEVHVTLPFEREDFLATSVAFAGAEWAARFDRALARATTVSCGVAERFLGDESLFAYSAALIAGAAAQQARELSSYPWMLALLDDDREGGTGGTADTLAHWQRTGHAVERIDLSALRRTAVPTVSPTLAVTSLAPAARVETRAAPLRRQVRTMLFADMVGFSRLTEEDTPSFLVNFFGAIADIVHRGEHRPVLANTWGDGLFMVFDEVQSGAEAALALRDAVATTDWAARGLPPNTSIRIAMHTGPVFEAHDPVIQRPNVFGSHVVRAARIEPVTAPGAVFVSAETAFLLAASSDQKYLADYLGRQPLAKGYGSIALYRLRRAGEVE